MPSKKKKPAANPARGFATTSIAKKVQPEQEKSVAEKDLKDHDNKHVTPPSDQPEQQQNGEAAGAKSDENSKQELHELSPEALEARLEEEELQILIERHAASTQRNVDRQVGKLTTDYRVLRGHAHFLQTRALLSEELEAKLLDLAKEDVESAAASVLPSARKSLPEEDTAARLWTLQRSLQSLGFSDDAVEQALGYTLQLAPPVDKDSTVWALEECLDWLVLNLPHDQLPQYDAQTGKAKVEAQDQYDALAIDVSAAAQKEAKKPSSSATTTTLTTAEPSDDEDVNISDLDSDLEPDELLSTHLATKTKLYEILPGLFDARGRGRNDQQVTSSTTTTSSTIRKLQNKLQKIEADVLFDKHEADARWTLKRNQIARDVADRKRLQLPDRSAQVGTPRKAEDASKRGPRTTEETSSSTMDVATDEEEDNAFADLFGAEDPTDAVQNAASDSALSGKTIRILNYGQVQGLSPSRVLEESCRARDSRASIAYKLVSNSAFANRHALTITWTKDQDILLPIKSEQVASSHTARTSSFTMLTVATPDENQSKAYIATFALFQIFSSSTKEEKAYLRMPSAFKDLYLQLMEQKKVGTEKSDRDTFKHLRDLVRKVTEVKEDEEAEEDVINTKHFRSRNADSGRNTPKLNEPDNDLMNKEQQLKGIWETKSNTASFQRMLNVRQKLPMHRFKAEALATIGQNQVTILCGETGCGKSTQLPSFVLEHELSHGRPCKIYCTEPRRISAITLAQRVAEELGEHKNDIGTLRSLIGYAIRLESQVTANTRLVYATTGIVLRMLESQDGFHEVTHIIVDEVHERSIETDFLLIILRSLITKRPNLKVVLMSATVDAQRFSKYFYGAPVIKVPGRTFPVETKFLEDAIELTGYTIDNGKRDQQDDGDDLDGDEQKQISNGKVDATYWKQFTPRTRSTLASLDEYRIDYELIYNLIQSIAYDATYSRYSQAILVFLPGIQEIRRLADMLHGSQLAQGFVIHALHSALSSDEQQAAFVVPPHGMRKIVISTNIAETGVTIPDITCVIDTGKHKEMRFDERRQISRLIESFISRANAKQRRGRAGRVQEGLCFHLFTKSRHDEQLSDQQTPEMLRLSLQDLIMRVKICKLGDIQSTLAEALDPPSAKNIRRAIDALIEVDALTQAEELTPLGQQLSTLPLDPYLGKLVLHGAIFSCLDSALTLAALLTSKSPFITPMNARAQADAARAAFRKGDWDLLTEYNAYTAWRRVCLQATSSQFSQESQFCRKNMLSPQTLANIEDLKAQLFSALADAGVVKLSGAERSAVSRVSNSGGRTRRFVQIPAETNVHNENIDLVSAVIAWSFYPKLLTREGKGWRNVATNQAISIHPTSVIRNNAMPLSSSVKFLSFYSILQSSGTKNYNANSLTPVAPLLLVLLAGEAAWHPTANVVSVDGARLRFMLDDWKTAMALKWLRKRLEEIVERRWKRPDGTLPKKLSRWWEVWQEIVAGWEKKADV